MMLTTFWKETLDYDHSLETLKRFCPNEDIQQPINQELTLLQIAAREGEEQLVLDLLEAGAFVDAKGHSKYPDGLKTPLYLALQHNHWKIAQILYYYGADLSTAQSQLRQDGEFCDSSSFRSLHAFEDFEVLYLESALNHRIRLFRKFHQYATDSLSAEEKRQLLYCQIGLLSVALANDQEDILAPLLNTFKQSDLLLLKSKGYFLNSPAISRSPLYWAMLKNNEPWIEYFFTLDIPDEDWWRALYFLEQDNRDQFLNNFSRVYKKLALAKKNHDPIVAYADYKRTYQAQSQSVEQTTLTSYLSSSSSSSASSSSSVSPHQIFQIYESASTKRLPTDEIRNLSIDWLVSVFEFALQNRHYLVLTNCHFFNETVIQSYAYPLFLTAIEQNKDNLFRFLLGVQPLYSYARHLLQEKPHLWGRFIQRIGAQEEEGILLGFVRRHDQESFRRFLHLWNNSLTEAHYTKLLRPILRTMADDYPSLTELRLLLRNPSLTMKAIVRTLLQRLSNTDANRINSLFRLLREHFAYYAPPEFLHELEDVEERMNHPSGGIPKSQSNWIYQEALQQPMSYIMPAFLSMEDRCNAKLVCRQWRKWINTLQKRDEAWMQMELKEAKKCMRQIEKEIAKSRWLHTIPLCLRFALTLAPILTWILLNLTPLFCPLFSDDFNYLGDWEPGLSLSSLWCTFKSLTMSRGPDIIQIPWLILLEATITASELLGVTSLAIALRYPIGLAYGIGMEEDGFRAYLERRGILERLHLNHLPQLIQTKVQRLSRSQTYSEDIPLDSTLEEVEQFLQTLSSRLRAKLDRSLHFRSAPDSSPSTISSLASTSTSSISTSLSALTTSSDQYESKEAKRTNQPLNRAYNDQLEEIRIPLLYEQETEHQDPNVLSLSSPSYLCGSSHSSTTPCPTSSLFTTSSSFLLSTSSASSFFSSSPLPFSHTTPTASHASPAPAAILKSEPEGSDETELEIIEKKRAATPH